VFFDTLCVSFSFVLFSIYCFVAAIYANKDVYSSGDRCASDRAGDGHDVELGVHQVDRVSILDHQQVGQQCLQQSDGAGQCCQRPSRDLCSAAGRTGRHTAATLPVRLAPAASAVHRPVRLQRYDTIRYGYETLYIGRQ